MRYLDLLPSGKKELGNRIKEGSRIWYQIDQDPEQGPFQVLMLENGYGPRGAVIDERDKIAWINLCMITKVE